MLSFFWVGGSLDCIFSAFRSAAEGDYSPAELKEAERLHGLIARALQRVKELEAAQVAQKALQTLVEQLPIASAVVDWNLQPLFHNAAARDLCRKLHQKGNGVAMKDQRANFRLPETLQKQCQELKNNCESEINTSPAKLRESELTGEFASECFRGSVKLIPVRYPSLGKPSFLITLERAAGSATAPHNVSALAKLTRSQRQIVDLVCEGKSIQEIADALSRSIGTIKSELNAIFRTLNVPSRSRLMILVR